MKKCVITLLGMSTLIFPACKHEILRDPLTGGNPGGGGNPTVTASCSPDTAYFQQQVLPVIVSNCSMSGCHDAVSHEDGIILTSYASIMSTGKIKPGNPEDSELFEKIIANDNDNRMPPPPRSRLTTDQVEVIRKWIRQGAKNNSCQSSVCDTASVGYSSSIKPMITSRCLGCHSSTSPGGGYDLSTYAGVKARMDDGKFWASVNHVTGFSPMPKNSSKLSDCELAKIKKWKEEGAPNN